MLTRRLLQHRSAFWAVLFPLACAWAAVARYRRYRWRRGGKRFRSRLPVICVGNLHSGGSGKTPLVMAITERLADRNPVIISRGYRGHRTREPLQVDRNAGDGPARYGDEPWMMAQRLSCPILISPCRRRALQTLERSKDTRLVILDDGFQHLPVAANVNIVVIGANRAVSDSDCLPLGDLREPWSALRDADVVVLTRGDDPENEADWREFLGTLYPSLPIFTANRRALGILDSEGRPLPITARVGAFCGIAAPERFQTDLSRAASVPAFSITFSDHHRYCEADVARVLAEKARSGASHLVTTEKDRAKAERLFAGRGERLWFSRIRHELPEQFWYFLQTLLESQ